MSEILFLSHRIPFPADRGDKIRSHHILKQLAALAPVHVATFADDALDAAEEIELMSLAASYRLVRRSKPLVLAGVQALLARKPVSLPAFHDPAIADYVAATLAARNIAAIYVFSGQMGQYVPADFGGRVIVDFVDVDSAKFDAYAKGAGGPMGYVYAREGRLLRGVEAQLAARADASLLVSAPEAALFTERLPAALRGQADVRVIGNGIDCDFFDRSRIEAAAQLAPFGQHRIIFTGQMDYAPNVAAAQRVIERVLPIVRRSLPDASFHVVGRNPAAELTRHHGKNGCHVWGRVQDVRCWHKGADLSIAPLEIARGIQNKVLEAMAMAMPVVVSPQAATGIPATAGRDFAVADSDQALADAVVMLLRDRQLSAKMGSAARSWAIAHASWSAALAPLAELLLPTATGPGRGA